MTREEFCDLIAKKKDEIARLSGEGPTTIFIHPDKCHELGLQDGDLIHGLVVECPSWDRLGALGAMTGIDPKSKALWDPDSVYVLKDKSRVP